jgi:hypothetical protein
MRNLSAPPWERRVTGATLAATVAPDPRAFSAFHEWLEAALSAREISPETASAGMGLSNGTCRKIIRDHVWPHQSTLDQHAEYFGVDRAALQALRPRGKSPVRVAQGEALAARYTSQLSTEEKQRRSLAALEVANGVSVEERRQRTSYAGRVSALRRTPDEYRAILSKSRETRHENGWWSGDGASAQLQQLKSLRLGEERPCLFCENPDNLIYRTASQLRRGYSYYHRHCFFEWRRTLPMRDKSRALGTIGWIWSQVKVHGDNALKKQIRAQLDAEVAVLRNPNRRGRRPLLLAKTEAAIWAAVMHVEYAITAREIGELAGFSSTTKPSRHGMYDYDIASSSAWDLIRYGRALLGL